MKILAIDTTRDSLTVVLTDGDKYFSKVGAATKEGHSPNIIPFIDELLNRAGISLPSIDAVAAVVGPGSFTGIRIGVATANAIAFALNLKRIEVNSFELLADAKSGDFICVIDALHGNYFYEKYENNKAIERGYFEGFIDEWKNIVRQTDIKDFSRVLFSVCSKKFLDNSFTDLIKPLYMRKSQAERMQDEASKT